MCTKATAILAMSVAEAEKDRAAWLALRNKGLGGSDAGVVMGVNPYKSRLTLWLEKTGQIEQPDLSDNEAVQWGIINEPNIAEWFSKKTGKKLRKCGTLVSVEHPWMLANVDRMIVGENAGLEIKTAGVKQSSRWKDDEVPDEYFCQCQHYMMVTGCDMWYLAVLIDGNKFVCKSIPRNDNFIRDLLTAEAAFWTLVESKIMPEVDGLKDTGKALQTMYPAAKPESVLELESTDELERLFDNHRTYIQSIKTMQQYVEECENKIKALMGENEAVKIGDHKATWSNMAGRVSVDKKRLQAELPDIYKAYTKVGKPSRRFSMS